ncbi:MAG: hypothetical protein H5U40_12715, partial [Polyangiaceae bacterium]|nr:hypothetical protein [Polyangiaceae bacterium]
MGRVDPEDHPGVERPVMRRSMGAGVCLVIGLLVACGESGSAPDAAAVGRPELLAPGEALAVALDDLRDRTEALVAALPPNPRSARDIELTHGTAGMLRTLALRDEAGDSARTEEARALLRRAAEAGEGEASCHAQAELVRLEALDRTDLSRAAREAEAGARRFDGSAAAACASRLRDAARALSASIRDEHGGEATLSRIAVYGANARGSADVRLLFELDRALEPTSIDHPEAAGEPRRLWLDFAATSAAAGVPEALEVNAGGLVRLRRSA